ncbi:unnamed protein product [Rotaria sordida]|uniref:Uncharacterized protein n=1 Tax=Rotaria sordida TaxID=392033 RepID=A0A819U9B4_9BILA|nr:unnamed protein product [Rotaria sordida]
MFNHILFCGAGEFLIMLSHDTLHSKQVIQFFCLLEHFFVFLHDVILRYSTMTLVSLTSNYLYLLMYIVEDRIYLDKSVLLLILFIEQFVTLPYITALRLIELIVCRRIEMMLTLDEQILHN